MTESEMNELIHGRQARIDTMSAPSASSDLFSAMSEGAVISQPNSAYPSNITSASLADLELDNSAMFNSELESSAIFDTLIPDSGDLRVGSSYLDSTSLAGEPTRPAKRKNSAEDDQDDGSLIKRENDAPAKVPRKPGRKPIKEEDEEMPPTKRKAQNRAAQRAFRERKEQHLKDLETKVAELTETTERDKQVNDLLKNQIARLETELRAYRQRSSTASRQRPSLEPANYPAATAVFGPGLGYSPQVADLPSAATIQSPASAFPPLSATKSSSRGRTPASDRAGSSDPCLTNGNSPVHSLTQSPIGLDTVYNTFNSQGLNPVGYKLDSVGDRSPKTARKQSQASWTPDDGTDSNGGISRVFRFNSESGSTMSHADSTSSLSQLNPQSSCNTSPETYSHDSPAKAPVTLGAVPSEPEQQSFVTAANSSNLDWLVAQNNGQFDPLLFGDYRESQDAILGDGDFNNGFFNDALLYDADTSTLNLDGLFTPATELPGAVAQPAPSKEFMAQVDAQQEGLQTTDTMVGLGDPYFDKMMKCQELRAKLESKGFKDGQFDIDNLCDELKSKAKCTGQGPAWTKSQLDEHFDSLIKS